MSQQIEYRNDLAVLTHDDLKSAANPMTLKRALKDIDAGMQPVSVEGGGTVVVEWEDATCRFPQGGLHLSMCSCPARSFCRHRVRSVLHLQQVWSEVGEGGGEEWADWSPAEYEMDELRSQAGKKLWKRALRVIDAGMRAEPESDTVATLPALDVRVRFLPGEPLSAAACSCAAPGMCEHRVVAALAWHDELPADALELGEDAFAAAERVFERVGELLGVGLDNLPAEVAGDLEALAQHVELELPGAAEDLQFLAKSLRGYERRSARFSPRAWLKACGRAAFRSRGLARVEDASRLRELVGQARRVYLEAAQLDVIALGSEGFQGDNGCLLRTWFVQPDTGDFLHVDVGRGGGQSTDVGALWRGERLWDKKTPRELAGAALSLTRARRSPSGALASGGATHLRTRREAAPFPDGLACTSAAELTARWSSQTLALLRDPDDATLPALLALHEDPFVGAPVFDEQRQILEIDTRLADGHGLTLEVPHRDDTQLLWRNMAVCERWPTGATHLFVRYWLTDGGIRARPIAAKLADGGLATLQFDELASNSATSTERRTGAPDAGADAVLHTLDGVLDTLESMAMIGLEQLAPSRLERLDAHAERLRSLGLDDGAAALAAVGDTRGEPRLHAWLDTLAWASELRERWVATALDASPAAPAHPS